MNHNKLIAISLILAIGVFLAAGCIGGREKGKVKAMLTTDKHSYKQGEEISFTLKNTGNTNISLGGLDPGCNLKIERKEKGEWKEALIEGKCTLETFVVKPGEKIQEKAKLNLKPGVYRGKVTYTNPKEGSETPKSKPPTYNATTEFTVQPEEKDSSDITITNNLDKKVYLNAQKVLTIEKKENGEWKDINAKGSFVSDLMTSCECPEDNPCYECTLKGAPLLKVRELSPGETINYNWTKKIYYFPDEECNGRDAECLMSKNASEGEYRIILPYSEQYVNSSSEEDINKKGKFIYQAELGTVTKVDKRFNLPRENPIVIPILSSRG